ncbi:hypothetical protein ACVBGC_26270 [Burkholderia stagnalis]
MSDLRISSRLTPTSTSDTPAQQQPATDNAARGATGHPGAELGELAALSASRSSRGSRAESPPPEIAIPTFAFHAASEPASPVGSTHQAEEAPDVIPTAVAEKAKAWRSGALVRQNYRVRTVSDGVVATTIKGDKDVFARVGMDSLGTRFPKEMSILAVDPAKFEAHVVGNAKVMGKKESATSDAATHLLADRTPPPGEPYVLVNGTYFNAGQTVSGDHPPHASIGETLSLTPDSDHFVPLPDEYAPDYVKVDLGRTSMMAAPELSSGGHPSFTEDRLEQPRYQFSVEKNQPGKLSHASDPNPRSMVSFPQGVGEGHNALTQPAASSASPKRDAVRFVAASSSIRGAGGTGLTLPEAAAVAARVDRMNVHPGRSINLDGGTSVSQRVGKIGEAAALYEVRSKGEGSTSNAGNSSTFIAMTRKKSDKDHT